MVVRLLLLVRHLDALGIGALCYSLADIKMPLYRVYQTVAGT